MIIQELDTSSVNAVLKYIIGVLITFIGGLVVYFRFEIKSVRDELKEERAYIKTEGTKNIVALVDNTNVLNRLSNENEKTGEKINEIEQISKTTKPIIEANSSRIIEIKSHLKNGD